MKLRLNNIKLKGKLISSELIMKDITAYLSEDIMARITSPINEILEKTYTLNGENIIKIVYRKKTFNDLFRRESIMYAFKEDETLFEAAIDRKHKDYFPSEVIDFKVSLVNKILTFFNNKVEKINSPQVTAIFNSILNETDIKDGISYATNFGGITSLVNAFKASKNPYIEAPTPDWTSKDAEKWGIDYVPNLRQWLLLYFDEAHFQIYPENEDVIIESENLNE